jgi:capsule polysaccharide modification protein KpsS
VNDTRKNFKILTVISEPDFTEYFFSDIQAATGIDFVHGLVGDASRVMHAQKKYPHWSFIALSQKKNEPLPQPDYARLAKLESVGIPTLRNMVLGDAYVRFRSEEEAFAYATLLSHTIEKAIKEHQPDAVLASFDCLHSAMSLAVAKSLGIPWVAMTFSVIPDNLTGFSNALTPNALLPLTRPVDDELRKHAESLMLNVRSGTQQVMAYKAPSSLKHWIKQYLFHTVNLARRILYGQTNGVDRYTAPTLAERAKDVLRRSINSLMLPTGAMLKVPPESKFVYYPMHMSPESMIDTWAPFYQDQLAFVAQLSRAMPADVEFVVKLHFSDPANYSRTQLKKLMELPRLRIASPFAPSRPFLEQSALVVGITGTSNLEAALRGKPVLLFGDSPYVEFPRSERAKRPDELYAQLLRMLNQPVPMDAEIIEAYATFMARYMPGRINDWSKPIEPDESKRLADCFKALRAYCENPTNRAEWYRQPPFVT